MILKFESQEDLIKAFVKEGGSLNGYIPSRPFDSSKIDYPVKVEVNKEARTFTLCEPKLIKVTEKAKKRLSKGALIGVICGSVALVALILGLLCYFLV